MNVNRWEGQLHLPPSPEADLPKLVKDADLPAGKAQVVDLTGPDPAPGDAARNSAWSSTSCRTAGRPGS